MKKAAKKRKPAQTRMGEHHLRMTAMDFSIRLPHRQLVGMNPIAQNGFVGRSAAEVVKDAETILAFLK